jgi:hypothetical protein
MQSTQDRKGDYATDAMKMRPDKRVCSRATRPGGPPPNIAKLPELLARKDEE